MFLLAFLRCAEQISSKEHWLLPSCPRYCYSYSFLCLTSTVSFRSTTALLSEHFYSCFLSSLLFQLKLSWQYSLQHVNPAFLNNGCKTRQICCIWPSTDHAMTVCCGAQRCCWDAGSAAGNRLWKCPCTLLCKCWYHYKMQLHHCWLGNPHFALCSNNSIFQTPYLNAVEVQSKWAIGRYSLLHNKCEYCEYFTIKRKASKELPCHVQGRFI